jgi:NADH dehydrogenase
MILVAGGTGRLGTALVQRLTARGEAVRVMTRDATRRVSLPPVVDVVTADARDRAAVAAAMDGCDLVVSAMHGFLGPRGISPASVDRDGNINLIDTAASHGGEVVLLSVVGAAAEAPMELFRMKHAAEQYAAEKSVPATIVRATAFMETWIDLLRQTAKRSGRSVVFGRGDNRINFVSVTDVAALVDAVCADRSSRGLTLEIGGPENVTLRQLARAVHEADGRAKPPRHIPRRALTCMAATIGRVNPQLGRQVRAALVMDTQPFSFDDGSARQRFPNVPVTHLAGVLGLNTPSGDRERSADADQRA